MNSDTILVGTGLIGLGAMGYRYRQQIINSALQSAIWFVDQYVELKWYYMGEPEIGQSIIRQEHEERCPVIRSTATHIVYTYRDACYFSPDTVAPKLYELDQVYDEDEYISQITLYNDGNKIESVDTELVRILNAFIGPLYDFHGKIPSIDDIKSNSKLSEPELNYDKIIILTANFKEYALENTQGT